MPFKYNALLGLGLDNTIPLDGAGKIPSTFLPSYVDDVEEYNNLAAFPATGETGKIYVAIDTGFAYRWSGSVYVQIGITAAAGSTTQVQFNDGGAFGGDAGLTYDKSTDALTSGSLSVTSAGAAATPSLTFTGDPNTGIYSPGADQLAIGTGGTGRLFVDANGNVGVGIVSTTLWGYANLAGGTTVHRLLARQADAFLGISGTSTTAELNFGLLNALSSPTLVARISTVNTITTNNGERADLAFYTKSGAVSTVAQERLRITSAGLVGIGTSAPNALLSVGNTSSHSIGLSSSASFYGAGSQVSSSVSTVGAFSTETATVGVGGVFAFGGKTNNAAPVYPFAFIQGAKASATAGNYSGYLRFLTVPADGGVPVERLRISEAGNVGIGTASPSATLELSGTGTVFKANTATTTSTAISLQLGGLVTSSNSGCFIKSHVNLGSTLNSQLSFEVNGGALEAARLDASGRLLVGTSSARQTGGGFTAQSQVEGSTTVSASSFTITSNRSADDLGPRLNFARSKGGAIGSNTIVDADAEYGGIYFFGADGTDTDSIGAQISAYVDGTPGANDMPGRIVLATTAAGAASPTERMRIANNGLLSTFFETNGITSRSAASNGTTSFLYRGMYNGTSTTAGGSVSYYVYTNGNVENTNNSYGAISDVKLKENIVDAGSQWDDLKALQVRKYNFKEGQTHTQIGLVAQEVELVSPGLVSESPDRDEDGNDLGTVTKSVNYSVLYMKAVKALQEAIARIETLETEVAALKGA